MMLSGTCKAAEECLASAFFLNTFPAAQFSFMHVCCMRRYAGAGVLFGNSGGVMEAAVRTVYEVVTGKVGRHLVNSSSCPYR